MSRLQKKCLFAAAGTHLLVIVVLLCAGFISSKPKVDNTQVLDVIPSTLVDAALNSGVQNPTPPPPVVKPVDPTPPDPTPPTPKPPEPIKAVEPVKIPDPVKPPEELKPVDKPDMPVPKPVKKKEIKVNLTPISPDAKRAADDAAKAEAAAKEKAKQDALKRQKAFQTAMNNIKNNSSSPTEVQITGTSSVSYANYASVVKKVYDDAWTPPDTMTSEDVTTKVSVTIGRDGHVISSRIINRSGESSVDSSVQRALDRVDFVAPFPEGATETQRTFIINFNPQAKKLSG